MKKQEAKVMLDTLRDVFDMVRIVEPFSGDIIDLDSEKPFDSGKKCYHIWHRDTPCEHCTTQSCCSEQKILCKYESVDGITFHITSKPINIEGTIVAFEIGTVQDKETAASVLHFADQDYEYRNKHDLKQHSDIARALSESYTSIYYVNINDGSYEEFNSDHLFKRLGLAVSGSDFFAGAAEVISKIAYDEDKDYILNLVDRAALLNNLERGKLVSREIRFNVDGNQTYFKITITYSNKDQDHIIFAVTNIHDEVIERLDKERTINMHHDIIDILAHDYTSVYYVDLDTREMTLTKVSNDVMAAVGDTMYQGIDFSVALETFLMAKVQNSDIEDLRKFGSIEYLKSLLTDQRIFTRIYRVGTENDFRFNEMKIVKVNDEPEAKAIVIGIADRDEEVRARQEAARALQEARDAAEAANNAKTSFLFNMSHDIRTPMNAITGFNTMALKHINDIDKVKECLEKVEISSKHLLSIINDILDIARIESGKAEIELQPVQISEAATELFEIVQQSVKDKGLTFFHDFSQIEHDYVMADHLRVSRVIMNIANNAVKYTPDGGTISYTIKEIASSETDKFAYDFVIADTGIGMSEEFLEHIFEAFSRDESSRISGIQGTGLGMAITRELIDLMGGTIDIKSTIGEGTTVTVHLEFNPSEVIDWAAQETETVDTSILAGKRILLVEDNELNREIAEDILEEYGIITETATNGKQAVEIVENYINLNDEKHFDLILMDIQMPIMDGYEATGAIRSLPWTDGYYVPIIAMTANAFAEDRTRVLEAGMDAHLSKPIDIDNLTKELVAILEKLC